MRKLFTAHRAVNVGVIRRMTDRLAPGMGVNGCQFEIESATIS
jgi:hypothetical protein